MPKRNGKVAGRDGQLSLFDFFRAVKQPISLTQSGLMAEGHWRSFGRQWFASWKRRARSQKRTQPDERNRSWKWASSKCVHLQPSKKSRSAMSQSSLLQPAQEIVKTNANLPARKQIFEGYV